MFNYDMDFILTLQRGGPLLAELFAQLAKADALHAENADTGSGTFFQRKVEEGED